MNEIWVTHLCMFQNISSTNLHSLFKIGKQHKQHLILCMQYIIIRKYTYYLFIREFCLY